MLRARPFPRALLGAVVVMVTLTGCRTAVAPQAAPAAATSSTAADAGRPPRIGAGARLVRATRAATTTTTTLPAATPATVPAASGTFTEGFDGDPARPAPLDSPRWHVVGHERDAIVHPRMTAAYGADCAPPPATHVVGSFDELAFLCRGQLGTALDGSAGFGSLTLTPSAMADFSGGAATLSFDVSTRRLSSRDWVQIWVTPFEEVLMAPWFDGVDLTGPAKRAIVVEIGGNTGDTKVGLKVVRDHVAEDVEGPYAGPLEQLAGPDRDALVRFELRMTRDHLKLSLPGLGRTLYDADLATPLKWDAGVVQFLQASYTPFKDCTTPGCGPNTWSWDNIRIAPARPFTIVKATEMSVSAPTSKLTFEAPAPAGAFLRFLAYARSIEISTDGGRTFRRPDEAPQAPENGHARSYDTPVPAGTREVLLRVREVDGNHPWVLQGASLWARGG
jgi:hypothetical protein